MDLVREKKVDIFVLIETKLWQEKREELRNKWLNEWECTINNDGRISIPEVSDVIWVGWRK